MRQSIVVVGWQLVSWRMFCVMTVAIVIAACATVAMQPTHLVADAQPTSDRTLTAMARAHSSSGFEAPLPAGTILRSVGTIPEGSVWRRLNRTLAARGYNVHEGWVVLNGQVWVGFYHPVERTFSPLSRPIAISMEDRPR